MEQQGISHPPKTIDEKIDALAVAVKSGFDAVDERFDGVDKRFDGVDKRLDGVDKRLDEFHVRLRTVENTMVTKSYLDEKLADLKGDLIVKLRKTNEKLDFIVSLLRARAIFSDEDLRRIKTEFQIFPSLS